MDLAANKVQPSDCFERGGKVWKIVAVLEKGGVLAYDEGKESVASPVCFISPVGVSDVTIHLRKKPLKRK